MKPPTAEVPCGHCGTMIERAISTIKSLKKKDQSPICFSCLEDKKKAYWKKRYAEMKIAYLSTRVS